MIIPPFLSTGDKVGVIATAKKVNKESTLQGIDMLKKWGLKVQLGEHLFDTFHQFAGTDQQRAHDLQQMIDNPEIRAIFIARGGYGTTRIIDDINFDSLLRKPKWICGFSDITAILLHLYDMGIASFHSPMPAFFYENDQKALDFMRNSLFGQKKNISAQAHPLNRLGEANGKLIGGNLSIICHMIGSATRIMTDGNILFLEDVGEQLYKIDRMMVQLKRAGLLGKLSGLIVGQFTDMEDGEESFGLDVLEIIHHHTSEFDYPLAFDFPIGHTNENMAIPVGVEGRLKISKMGTELSC
jgi:muramoyltetrapeptide carboxypeptidase